ncbi:MAG: cytochrome c [Terracidiphilus sp.]|jgi:mono/diheme cytochrome c family protein
MLKPLLFVSTVVLFGVTALSTPGSISQNTTPAPAAGQKNPVKPTEKSQARARDLYRQDCAICHGDNGNGKTDVASSMGVTLEDWSNPATLADKQDQNLFNVIRNGKGQMPAEPDGRAKDDEVWNLIIYIRNLYKLPPAPAPAPAPADAAPAPPPSN